MNNNNYFNIPYVFNKNNLIISNTMKFFNKEIIKNNETDSIKKDKKDEEIIGTFKIRIKDKRDKNYILHQLKNHQHLKNIYTILLNEFYPNNNINTNNDNDKEKQDKKEPENKWNLWNKLSNPIIMKGVFSSNSGKKTAEDIELINKTLKDNHFFKEFKSMYQKINDKNGSMIFRNVKGSFSTYFKNLDNYLKTKEGQKPQKPKAKKIKKLNKFSLNIENDKWNITKRNEIRITLEKKGKIFYLGHKGIIDKIGKENIKSLNISYENEQLFFNFTYIKTINNLNTTNNNNINKKNNENNENNENKQASIDLGINNIISLFIDDKVTSSLIINGKGYKHYNVKYNRLKSKLDTEISKNILSYKEIEKNNKIEKIPLEYNERGIKLRSFKKYITYKRNEYYENEFQQLSKKIVHYLLNNKVNELILSRNLINGKRKGEIELKQGIKQGFYNIPYGQLLDYIEEKCIENGIIVVNIDESFTSKTSCISGDVNLAKEINNEYRKEKENEENINKGKELLLKLKREYKEKLATVLKGRRAKRGLYIDLEINKIFNSDLNGSVNHLKVWNKKDYNWLKDYLFKICNPIKIYNLKELDIINKTQYKLQLNNGI